MPELPDLQAFSGNLTKIFGGKTLKKIDVLNAKKLKASVKEVREALEGQQLSAVKRVGKELHFEFKNGRVLGLHLMLHGQLHVFENENTNKYVIVEMLFDNGKGLALSDFQAAATPTLDPEPKNVPDALALDEKYLNEKLSKKRSPIKTVLMDQKVVGGIGNAYADEILWDAKLSPFCVANKIPEDKIKTLVKSIKKVLRHAEKEILKAEPNIISGEVRDFLKVHLPREKKTASGSAILQKPIGGRKTYYTDEQELFE